MKQIGLVCKRPRYFYSEKDPHGAQKKKAIVRQLRRLLPELRRAWSLCGEQARVSITGQNARCVLFGTINPRTGIG
ncbi:MAG: hypothetical protein JWQ71_2037 [Pedosphaera sp.]|nr:hypothetical protein [Pedosphaera sp.]